MALFLINRYLGDESDNDGPSNESRSKALLAKLQEKARARQQQKSATEEESKSQLSGEEVIPKKKRKLKDQDDLGQGQKRKKKEKLEHKDLSAETDTGENCLSRKKKKRKETKTEELEAETSSSEEVEKSVGTVKKNSEQQRVLASDKPQDLDSEESEDEVERGEDESLEETKEPADQATVNSEKDLAQSGFTILGGFEKKTVPKVQMVLPQWLAQPDVVQKDIKKNLVPVVDIPGICPRLLKKLETNGIKHFFPVQAEVIPAILESVCHGLLVGRGGYRPRDICVSAPTGSGKTLAFVIPVIQALSQRVVREVRALAVLPTKELAQQVCKVFSSYAEGSSLKVVMVTGQKSFAAEQASLVEHSGGRNRSLADIVVATPGRLVDHINKTADFSLQHLRFLIIDEADRMIDSMHQSWLSQVVKAVYRSRSGSNEASIFRRTEPGPITATSLSQPQMPLQKLLFSATLTQNPEKLQQLGLHQPRLFSSVHSRLPATDSPSTPDTSQPQERFNFPQGLTEYYVPCTLSKKPLLILHFLLRLKFSPVLCFTNSREAAHRLFLLVQLFGGVQVAEFSSRLSPNERKKSLKDFEQGKIQLLISTDAAARGIDIKGVKCVVNYDAPQFIRTYVHRVGRTARAGKAGLAFTFLLGIQEKNFLQMVRDAGSPGVQKQIVKPENLKGMEGRYQQILLELENVIKEERAKKRS
ncbi:ATP-dependent RNA helicase DDX51 isoform X1 [Anguilla anguilla]|uniref:ATP-dependent RNA helicase DDX51 isoform X1 n=1 Tax=Anguilla anguilla TaxID=7936 RepID=UPI0015AC5DDD|nr:ATP-dependent RNA helicase DDX51 isoform X1 [Anguilla anguilla]